MKKLLTNMLISFATGISFVIGIGVASMVFDAFENGFSGEQEYVKLPEDVNIIEHKLKSGKHFIVEGALSNNSNQDWDTVIVEVVIFAGNAELNDCDERVADVLANGKRNFQVECYGVSGVGLPSNIRYEISARTGIKSS